jgi:cyclopropane-fatty-acyl-phospholipid synthase
MPPNANCGLALARANQTTSFFPVSGLAPARIRRRCWRAGVPDIRDRRHTSARWRRHAPTHHYHPAAPLMNSRSWNLRRANGAWNQFSLQTSRMTAGSVASLRVRSIGRVSMDGLLRRYLTEFIRHGSMTVTTASGDRFTCGDGAGRPVAVRFATKDAQRKILLNPELALGEAFMDGEFIVEAGTIADALAILLGQPDILPRWAKPSWRLRQLTRHIRQFNLRSRSRNNVAHHYDLDGRLYSLFLDADKQYSCAYFEKPDASLDDAQLAKKRHIVAKLLVDRRHRVLDIGSGWGGLALYLADIAGADVTGVTLSTEQLQVSSARAAENGLTQRARFILQDYRDVVGPFDRIVSVGMFEHVGIKFYGPFFQRCAELLADDGVMLLHSIGRSQGPDATNPWITKYIFPGGYLPAMSEVLPAIERAGLLVCDIEILRLHYAETLKAWRERFMARREEAVQLYDERFARMWEFYLSAAEMTFRKQGMMNFQIQLTKRQGVVPTTRDYIGHEEGRLRELESGSEPRLRLAGE